MRSRDSSKLQLGNAAVDPGRPVHLALVIVAAPGEYQFGDRWVVVVDEA
jgi:hypothetical protein